MGSSQTSGTENLYFSLLSLNITSYKFAGNSTYEEVINFLS